MKIKQWCIATGLVLFWQSPATIADNMQDAVFSCILEPSREARISSYVPGVVKSINVERGDRVHKGQQLFTLESGVEQAFLESAQARANFARRKFDRNQDLLKKGLLSDYERDEMITDVRLGELAVQEALVRLAQKSVNSPVDGVVVQRNSSQGEYVGTDPVVELVSLNPLHAELVISSSYYGHIELGAPVSLAVEQGADSVKIAAGQVTVVDQLIDAASGTFGVRVEVPNADFKLSAGLKCSVGADTGLISPQ